MRYTKKRSKRIKRECRDEIRKGETEDKYRREDTDQNTKELGIRRKGKG